MSCKFRVVHPIIAPSLEKLFSYHVSVSQQADISPQMPGGTAVTIQTDPVQKVVWGPTSRVEACSEAKKLIKQWRQAVKEAKNAKGKRKPEETDTESEPESDNEQTGKAEKSYKKA